MASWMDYMSNHIAALAQGWPGGKVQQGFRMPSSTAAFLANNTIDDIYAKKMADVQASVNAEDRKTLIEEVVKNNPLIKEMYDKGLITQEQLEQYADVMMAQQQAGPSGFYNNPRTSEDVLALITGDANGK